MRRMSVGSVVEELQVPALKELRNQRQIGLLIQDCLVGLQPPTSPTVDLVNLCIVPRVLLLRTSGTLLYCDAQSVLASEVFARGHLVELPWSKGVGLACSFGREPYISDLLIYGICIAKSTTMV